MKKVLLVSFVAILMVLSGAAGWFLRGGNVADDAKANELMFATAKNTISTIVQCAQWGGGAQPTSSSRSQIQRDACAVQYEDYASNDVSYNGKEDFVKAFIKIANFACEGGARANTYYYSTAKYRVGANEVTGTMLLYIKLSKTSANFYLYDVQNKINCALVISSEQNTIESCQINGYLKSTFGAQPGITYFEIKSSNSKIVDFAYCEVSFVEEKVDLRDISVEDVSSINIFDCDVQNGRHLNVSKANMTDAEVLGYANKNIEKIYSARFEDLTQRNYVDSNIMARLYESLGYDVID